MTRIADRRSIVAVDPNSRGLAFVFFEDGQLLDWGTRRRDGDELALLDEILGRSKADVLVLENAEAPRSERRPRTKRLLSEMRRHAARKDLSVVAVSRYLVRKEWAERGMTRKHEVATEIASMFPELEPLVPRQRKVYRSEAVRGDIFDAASLVLSEFGAEQERISDQRSA
jgi:hypothetical protein